MKCLTAEKRYERQSPCGDQQQVSLYVGVSLALSVSLKRGAAVEDSLCRLTLAMTASTPSLVF